MTRIVIRCDDEDTRVDWRNLCNKIDDESDYEEILQGIVEYLNEDQVRKDAVARIVRGREFR